jgi:hypothetical protein
MKDELKVMSCLTPDNYREAIGMSVVGLFTPKGDPGAWHAGLQFTLDC